jgi:hypothetical protein
MQFLGVVFLNFPRASFDLLFLMAAGFRPNFRYVAIIKHTISACMTLPTCDIPAIFAYFLQPNTYHRAPYPADCRFAFISVPDQKSFQPAA